MDWLNTAVAALALVISALAFFRTLFLDQVVADLVFEWNATLGVAVGKLASENPLRHSIYLSGIRSEEPARQAIVVRMAGTGLDDVISDAYEEAAPPNNRVAVINARIPPRDNLELELDFKNHGTGLRVTFEWSTAMPWTVKCLIPRGLKYSATDIDAMKRAAKRAKPKEEK
jgi:hypothetical protein